MVREASAGQRNLVELIDPCANRNAGYLEPAPISVAARKASSDARPETGPRGVLFPNRAGDPRHTTACVGLMRPAGDRGLRCWFQRRLQRSPRAQGVPAITSSPPCGVHERSDCGNGIYEAESRKGPARRSFSRPGSQHADRAGDARARPKKEIAPGADVHLPRLDLGRSAYAIGEGGRRASGEGGGARVNRLRRWTLSSLAVAVLLPACTGTEECPQAGAENPAATSCPDDTSLPDVPGLPLRKAVALLRRQHLAWEVVA